jgi:hypothetical protein
LTGLSTGCLLPVQIRLSWRGPASYFGGMPELNKVNDIVKKTATLQRKMVRVHSEPCAPQATVHSFTKASITGA